MTTVQQGLIALLKASVTGTKQILPDDFSMEEILETIRRHSVETLAYDGAVRCGIDRTNPAMQKLFMRYCIHLARSEQQMNKVREIYSSFDAAQIDYLPLKGSVLKELYPKPELRSMGDADILIREEQYAGIPRIMESLGFTFVHDDGRCEIVWDSKALHTELHRCPIDPASGEYFYYGSGWGKAVRQEGCRYAFTPEDTFIYLFLHFVKHYRVKGIGLRHVLDLWVYRRNYPEMDEGYILGELRGLGLDRFYGNVLALLDAWFHDGIMNEVTEFISRYIFSSGNFGEVWNYYIYAEAVKAKMLKQENVTRVRSVARMLFPEYQIMKQRYPVLEKIAWLLPLMWLKRWIDLLLHKSRNIKHRLKSIQKMDNDSVSAFSRSLEFVGLEVYVASKE